MSSSIPTGTIGQVALLLSLFAMNCFAAEERYVAWLADDSEASRIDITRSGQPQATYAIGFLACDQVRHKLNDSKPRDIVIVTLGGQRVRLAGHDAYAVRCDGKGERSGVLAYLKALVRSIDDRARTVYLAGRGSCEPTRSGLEMPIIAKSKDATMITATGRPLTLTWFGQFAPYRIEVRRVVNGKEGDRVFDLPGLQQRSLRTGGPSLGRGTYTVTVTDACGGTAKEYELRVVDAGQRPSIPPELSAAALTESERTIWYANYLVAQGTGQWQLEAMQLVAALADQNDRAVQEWLESWGDW